MESILPVILSLVVGSWSDIHGRKLPMMLSAFGMAVSYLFLLVLTYLPNFCAQNPWILLLPSIPIALGGNFPVFMMSTMSYLGDLLIIKNASTAEKLYRYLIGEACFLFGGPIGLYFGGFLFHYYGHWMVFLAAAAVELIVVMYCYIRIRNDSVELASGNLYAHLPEEKERKAKTPQSFCDQTLLFVKKMFSASFRERQGRLRSILLLLLFCQALATAVYCLDGAIGYIYVKNKFNWSIEQFTKWKASYMSVVSIGAVLIAPLLSNCFSEPVQATLGCLMTGIFYFLVGIVEENDTWLIWVAMIFPILALVPTSVCRAVVTRIVCAEELGSVFGLISAMAGLMPMLMSNLASSIFKYAVFHNINTGIVYFIASTLFATGFVLCLVADVLWWTNKHLIQ